MVQCKPQNYMVNNIIGGPCPCYLDNSECDHRQEVCYCVKGYVPSVDKRRCLKETLMLNEKCEEDHQCQSNDINAVCRQDYQKCACKDRFIYERGQCASAIGKNFGSYFPITSNTLALQIRNVPKLFGSNTKCGSATPLCICTKNYYASLNHTTCLKSMQYLQACNETVQCIDALGLGGQCIDNLQCSGKYFADKRDHPRENYSWTVCTLFNERGQSCVPIRIAYEQSID
ncbi:hypothetical protein DOY81_009891 [Sarcophaga bullata]|nr:hypothetical protein DOY81_009891 [Sarcophaga bullata]